MLKRITWIGGGLLTLVVSIAIAQQPRGPGRGPGGFFGPGFGGPATLLLPSLDMNLTAQQKLSGSRQGQSAFGRLDALGDVEVRSAGATLNAPALYIDRKLDAQGSAIASMIAAAPPPFLSPDDEEPLDL